METGLVLPLPGLEPALRRWRRRDPAARAGMPPHVTLLYPFVDSRAVDDDVRIRINDALGPFGPQAIAFDRLGDFAGGVWLEPADPAPLRAMIATLAAAFPDHPPYGGAFDEAVPHLTVAAGAPALLEKIRREAPAVLPLTARAEAASLFVRLEDGWVPAERFALDGSATSRPRTG